MQARLLDAQAEATRPILRDYSEGIMLSGALRLFAKSSPRCMPHRRSASNTGIHFVVPMTAERLRLHRSGLDGTIAALTLTFVGHICYKCRCSTGAQVILRFQSENGSLKGWVCCDEIHDWRDSRLPGCYRLARTSPDDAGVDRFTRGRGICGGGGQADRSGSGATRPGCQAVC
jgi:hypothetical protein